ncbi:MAG: ECF transporter S component [Clostridia bacterium]
MLIWGALFGAVIAVSTAYIKIPGPGGYYHLGDGFIYAAAILLGPTVAGTAAAIGSLFADVLAGWPAWALPSFFIKGLTALVVGYLARGVRVDLHNVGAMVVGASITVVGYSAAAYFIFGEGFALFEFYGNLGQTGSGIIVASVLLPLLSRALKASGRG